MSIGLHASCTREPVASQQSLQSEQLERCERDATDFGEWMQALFEEGYDGVPGRRRAGYVQYAAAPSWAAGEPVGTGLYIILKEHTVSVLEAIVDPQPDGGIGASDREQLRHELAAAWRRYRDSASRFAPPNALQFEIDRDARWATVVAVSEEAHLAGWHRVAFAVQGKVRQRPPPRSTMDAELVRVVAEVEAAGITGPPVTADLRGHVYGKCPEVSALIVRVERGETPSSAVAEELPRLIRECGCAMDFAEARTLHWFLAGRTIEPHLVAVTVDLADAGHEEAIRVVLAPDTPWSAAVEHVSRAAASGGPARFELE